MTKLIDRGTMGYLIFILLYLIDDEDIRLTFVARAVKYTMTMKWDDDNDNGQLHQLLIRFRRKRVQILEMCDGLR